MDNAVDGRCSVASTQENGQRLLTANMHTPRLSADTYSVCTPLSGYGLRIGTSSGWPTNILPTATTTPSLCMIWMHCKPTYSSHEWGASCASLSSMSESSSPTRLSSRYRATRLGTPADVDRPAPDLHRCPAHTDTVPVICRAAVTASEYVRSWSTYHINISNTSKYYTVLYRLHIPM